MFGAPFSMPIESGAMTAASEGRIYLILSPSFAISAYAKKSIVIPYMTCPRTICLGMRFEPLRNPLTLAPIFVMISNPFFHPYFCSIIS